MHQQAEAFVIKTKDKTPISATRFSQERSSSHLIIVCPAAGVPQHYYKHFAEYASQHRDFDVVTFDYRGVGLSLQQPIKKDKSTMSDWGAQDLAAVIRWADKKYDKIFMIGHSVAGQIFPKAQNHGRVLAAYFVGSQSAYHGHWKGKWWFSVLFFWYFINPVINTLFGYLPGWALGGKVSLPAGVASEWRKWGVHPQGVLQGNAQLTKRFEEVRIHAHFVNIEDDRMFAPSAATQALMRFYKNAITTFQYIKPDDVKESKIGHFGFFRKNMAKKLWPMPMYYFAQYVNKLD